MKLDSWTRSRFGATSPNTCSFNSGVARVTTRRHRRMMTRLRPHDHPADEGSSAPVLN